MTADEVYGGDGRLRRWLEEREWPMCWRSSAASRCGRAPAAFERPPSWSPGCPRGRGGDSAPAPGAKGERLYAWARVADPAAARAGRGHWLLVRRSLTSGELAYYVCYGPAATTLAELVRVAGCAGRWSAASRQGKGETGLDHYQVRRYQAWYRHVTLSMLAQAFLAVKRARAAAVGAGGS